MKGGGVLSFLLERYGGNLLLIITQIGHEHVMTPIYIGPYGEMTKSGFLHTKLKLSAKAFRENMSAHL